MFEELLLCCSLILYSSFFFFQSGAQQVRGCNHSGVFDLARNRWHRAGGVVHNGRAVGRDDRHVAQEEGHEADGRN